MDKLSNTEVVMSLVLVVVFFISAVIFGLMWWMRNSQYKQLKLSNSLLRMEKNPDDLDFEQIIEIYREIEKFSKLEEFENFSNNAIEFLSANINAQKQFKDLGKFFVGWKDVRGHTTIVLIYKMVVEKTKQHVRSLAEDHLKALKEDPDKSEVYLRQFNNDIEKPYFTRGYELSNYFFKEKESIEEDLELKKQRNSHKD